ncbi:MAG TPA: cytochrome c [Candidatus Binataceae bacterium]|nr:cytochrome c [Candidatus Binataceae bacterium]
MLSVMMRRQVWMLSLLGLLLLDGTVFAGSSSGTIARGRALFINYCASCHGLNADGKGPVAPALTTPPSNLRLLSERYGNPLPEDQIARFIDGRADVKAHGPRDMPVWGEMAWRYGDGRKGQVKGGIAALVAYLHSIQKREQNASLNPPSGIRRWVRPRTGSIVAASLD